MAASLSPSRRRRRPPAAAVAVPLGAVAGTSYWRARRPESPSADVIARVKRARVAALADAAASSRDERVARTILDAAAVRRAAAGEAEGVITSPVFGTCGDDAVERDARVCAQLRIVTSRLHGGLACKDRW